MEKTLLAYGIGFLSAFSGCVYPIFPLVYGLFSGYEERKGIKSFFYPLLYVLGISLTYSILAVIVAVTAGIFGSYLGHPGVKVGLFVLLVFFALLLLEALPFKLPGIHTGIDMRKYAIFPFFLPLLTGIFSGIIIAPCTAPFLGVLIIQMATTYHQEGNFLLLLGQIFSYSLGLGTPLFLIGLLAMKLPKPGKWLYFFQILGAAILIGMGFYYIWDFIPNVDQYLSYLWIPIGVGILLLGLYLIKKFLSQKEPLLKRATPLAFLLGVGFFLVFLPLFHSSLISSSQVQEPLLWEYSYQEALKKAKKEKKILLIDFYAEWCKTCVDMEVEVYQTQRFQEIVKRYNLLPVKLDFTDPEDKTHYPVAEKYEIYGLPSVVLVDHKENLIGKIIGYEDKEEFFKELLALLEKGKK